MSDDAELIANLRAAYAAVMASPQRGPGITGQTTEAIMRATIRQINEWNAEHLLEAADAIARLTAERDEARDEASAAKNEAADAWSRIDNHAMRADAIAAENERLRATGARFLAVVDHHFPSGVTGNEVEAREAFRAALEPQEPVA